MLQGWQKKTSILKNSWYSQISLAYIHFSKLFIWKAFQTYRCKNKNSTQNTHTPSPQLCLLLNICPVYHSLSFTCTFPYIHMHIHALLQSHPAPTCSHLRQMWACAHTYTLTSTYTTHTVLCWVLCGGLSKWPGQGLVRGVGPGGSSWWRKSQAGHASRRWVHSPPPHSPPPKQK